MFLSSIYVIFHSCNVNNALSAIYPFASQNFIPCCCKHSVITNMSLYIYILFCETFWYCEILCMQTGKNNNRKLKIRKCPFVGFNGTSAQKGHIASNLNIFNTLYIHVCLKIQILDGKSWRYCC